MPRIVVCNLWTWRDLGRALQAAWWAFFHADDLTMLRHTLEEPVDDLDSLDRKRQKHLHQWLAKRFLGGLPIR